MPANILVVDDDEAVLTLVGKVLEREGHKVVGAGEGVEAARLASTLRFDLLIVDKNLPGMSGLELIAGVRRSMPEVPAILITAYPEPILGPTVRIQGYLGKPFESMAKIVEAVNRALWLDDMRKHAPRAPLQPQK